MFLSRRIRAGVALATCIAIITPTSVLSAAPRTDAAQSTVRTVDVQLDAHGNLSGDVVDRQGNRQAGVDVHVWQAGQPRARVVSDNQGRFAVRGLKGGVYQILTETGGLVVRLWQNRSGPPAAKSRLMIVQGPVVRGQLGPHPHPLATRAQDGVGTGLFGGSITNALSNPWLVAGLVGVGIALPIAVANDDDDDGS